MVSIINMEREEVGSPMGGSLVGASSIARSTSNRKGTVVEEKIHLTGVKKPHSHLKPT